MIPLVDLVQALLARTENRFRLDDKTSFAAFYHIMTDDKIEIFFGRVDDVARPFRAILLTRGDIAMLLTQPDTAIWNHGCFLQTDKWVW